MSRKTGGVVLALGGASVAAFIVGFATNYWFLSSRRHFGLWRSYCTDSRDCSDLVDTLYRFAFMWAVRILMCIALVLGASAIFANLAWVTRSDENRQKPPCKSAQGLYIASGVFSLAAVVTFGLAARLLSDHEGGTRNLGYSYWCSAVGGPLQLLLGSVSSCVTRAWLNSREVQVTTVVMVPATGAAPGVGTEVAPVEGVAPPPPGMSYPPQPYPPQPYPPYPAYPPPPQGTWTTGVPPTAPNTGVVPGDKQPYTTPGYPGYTPGYSTTVPPSQPHDNPPPYNPSAPTSQLVKW